MGLFNFFNNKKNRKKLANYNKSIEINPNDATIYLKRGMLLAELKDYKGAKYDYTKVIEITPNNAGAYFWRGMLLVELKEYKGAITDFTKSLEIGPDSEIISRIYYVRGAANYKLADAFFDEETRQLMWKLKSELSANQIKIVEKTSKIKNVYLKNAYEDGCKAKELGFHKASHLIEATGLNSGIE